MNNKPGAASIVLGALVIALIAGVAGWTLRSPPEPAVHAPELTGVPELPVDRTMAPPVDAVPQRNPALSQATTSFAAQSRSMVTQNDARVAKLVAAGMQKLQSRYQSESVDPAWASKKQSALASVNRSPMLEQASAQPLSFGAQCRMTVCLIGADFSSADAANDWFTLFTVLAGGEMSNAAASRMPNPDGTIHLQIYGQARK